MTDRFLPTSLRRALERDIKAARKVAEDGVADAIRRLGVADPDAPAHLSDDDRAARRRLRAHARALGDTVTNGVHTVDRLIEAAAYAQWHRRLFARFLAERGLLRHPEHCVAVTLEEAEELAAEEGYTDGWSAAEAYASRMLPAVFQPDDPVLALTLAPEHAQALRKLVLGLDAETFQAEDSLGWTYQFWRALEKDRVNKAGHKIGARDLPAVTQLFTEPYMVKFLLHNTLGAWRAGKELTARPDLASNAANEAGLRTAVSPPGYAFDMLRFVRSDEGGTWRPAAGTYPGWPKTAAVIRALDPCCGSGHFLTELLAILSALRADEEGLTETEAVAAVLRDNLFGLELDGRCVQIAAFAVALTAWRIGGFQPFGQEQVHIAWVGAPPPLDRAEFESLGNGDGELRYALGHLHDLFRQAPVLGSLLEPTGGDLLGPKVMGKLDASLPALVDRTRSAEPERAEGAVAARGMADALSILGERYDLVATNVPFLGRGKQADALKIHIDRHDPDAKSDLATTMLSRSLRLLKMGGAAAVITSQNFAFQSSYKRLRSNWLRTFSLDFFSPLGEEAWDQFGDRGPKTVLMSLSALTPDDESSHAICDVAAIKSKPLKVEALHSGVVEKILQVDQYNNVDHIIGSHQNLNSNLLNAVALPVEGMSTGDGGRYLRTFWEVKEKGGEFEYFVGAPSEGHSFGGREQILWWQNGKGALSKEDGARVQGQAAWGKQGVLVGAMRDLHWDLYFGERHDKATAALVVSQADLPAVAAFIGSEEYRAGVRRLDPAVHVATATLAKVGFDLSYWNKVAGERYPNGLPAPYSHDPTQWLFHGHPAQAEQGTQLHVALARLAGYRWPAESDPDMRLSADARAWIVKAASLPKADADGVLPVPAVAGDRPLADRLREYLNVAMPGWDEAALVRAADERIDRKVGKDLSLETWLRDRAFRQHAALFHNRPFLWQVWDGQKDGFSAFLHYHRLDHAAVQKLTYTLLGTWITRRQAENDDRRVEAAAILKNKLETILEGEAPYDIFVRWKPLEQQPLGWNPDLDDGVRLNIRPWVKAGVLKGAAPKGIKWGVDRGKDTGSAPWFSLDKGERNNDRHTTLAEKYAAREAATVAKVAKA